MHLHFRRGWLFYFDSHFYVISTQNRLFISMFGNLTEHVSETLIGRVLLLGLILLLLSLGSWGSLSDWGGDGEGLWVGDALLELLNLGPAVLGGDGNGKNVLVGVDNGVHDGWESWEVDGEGDGSDGGDSAGEGLEELLLTDVKDGWWEAVALVVNLSNAHSVGERRDVEHVQEGSLGGSDLGSGLDELELSGNFNGTTGNLGWDTKGLEERGLSWLHSGVTGWDEDIIWGDGTSTGWGSDLVGEDDGTDLLEVIVGEDESDVTLDVGEETLVLWGISDEALDGTADHGVLAHQDDTLAAESLTNLVHLLGGDIVNLDDEDATVLLEKALQLIEVAGLVCALAPHIFLLRR